MESKQDVMQPVLIDVNKYIHVYAGVTSHLNYRNFGKFFIVPKLKSKLLQCRTLIYLRHLFGPVMRMKRTNVMKAG